jgi:hypothetical protein
MCYTLNSATNNTFNNDNRSLAIVIEIKVLMLQAINRLKSQISTVIRDVNDQSSGKWIQRYILVTYTDAGN